MLKYPPSASANRRHPRTDASEISSTSLGAALSNERGLLDAENVSAPSLPLAALVDVPLAARDGVERASARATATERSVTRSAARLARMTTVHAARAVECRSDARRHSAMRGGAAARRAVAARAIALLVLAIASRGARALSASARGRNADGSVEFEATLAQRYEGDLTRVRVRAAVSSGGDGVGVRLVVHELGGGGKSGACDAASVGGTFDPDGSGGVAVGDVSENARANVVASADGEVNAFIARDLPLVGRRSVVGRTLAIWRASDDGHTGGTTPLACARIEEDEVEGVVNARSTIGTTLSRISGVVTFSQAANDPTGDTRVVVQLVNRAQADASPENFRWAIYTGAAGSGSSCARVGAVYNPSDKDLCAADSIGLPAENCPVGQLWARQTEVYSQRVIQFTDSNLPLSGDASIIGKSFVLLQRDGTKVLCSDIVMVRDSNGSRRFSPNKNVSTGAQVGMVTIVLLAFLLALRLYGSSSGSWSCGSCFESLKARTSRGSFARVSEEFHDIPLTNVSPFSIGDDDVRGGGIMSKASSVLRGVASRPAVHTHSN